MHIELLDEAIVNIVNARSTLISIRDGRRHFSFIKRNICFVSCDNEHCCIHGQREGFFDIKCKDAATAYTLYSAIASSLEDTDDTEKIGFTQKDQN